MLESMPDLYWALPLGVCLILVLVALLAAGARPSETAPPAFRIFNDGEKKKARPKKKAKENVEPSAKAAAASSAPNSAASRSAVVDRSGEPVKAATAAKTSPANGSVTKPAAAVALPTASKKVSKSGSSESGAGAKLKPGAAAATVDTRKPSSAKPDGAARAQQQRPAKQQAGSDEQDPWQVQLSKKTKKQKVAVASVTASTSGGAPIIQYEAVASFVKELIPTSSTNKKPDHKAAGASQQQLSGASLASAEVADTSPSSVAVSPVHESHKQQLTEGAAAAAESSKVVAPATQKRGNAGINAKSASGVAESQSAGAFPSTKAAENPVEVKDAAAGATGAADNSKQDISTNTKPAAVSKVTNSKSGADSPAETSAGVDGASQDNVAFDELGGWQEAKSMRPVKTAKAKKARRE